MKIILQNITGNRSSHNYNMENNYHRHCLIYRASCIDFEGFLKKSHANLVFSHCHFAEIQTNFLLSININYFNSYITQSQ